MAVGCTQKDVSDEQTLCFGGPDGRLGGAWSWAKGTFAIEMGFASCLIKGAGGVESLFHCIEPHVPPAPYAVDGCGIALVVE